MMKPFKRLAPAWGLALVVLLALLVLSGAPFGCKARTAGAGDGGSFPLGEWRGWKSEPQVMEFGREDLSKYLAGAAGHYLAYDFRRLWVRPYHNPAGEALTAELYDLSSEEEAYGVFSWDWTGETVEIPDAQALYSQGALRLRKGKYYLSIVSSTPDDRYRDDLFALAEEIARQLPGGLPTPPLVRRLPRKGLDEDTVFYFHTQASLDGRLSFSKENILQLSRRTNGVLARYLLPEGRADLLLVEFPEGEASDVFQSLRDKYFLKAVPIQESDSVFMAETRSGVYEGMVLMRRLIAIVVNGENEKACRQLLAAATAISQ